MSVLRAINSFVDDGHHGLMPPVLLVQPVGVARAGTPAKWATTL